MRKLLFLLVLVPLASAGVTYLPTSDELAQEYLYACSASGGFWTNGYLISHITIPDWARGLVNLEISATPASRGWSLYPYEARLYACLDAYCVQAALIETREVGCGSSCGNACQSATFTLQFQAQAGVRHYKVRAVTGGVPNVMLTNGYSRAWITNEPPSDPKILTPASGTLLGGILNVAWTVSTDPEGSAITYLVEYSLNNGQTWTPITTTPDTATTWDTTSLPGGRYLLRVRAFDGQAYSPSALGSGAVTRVRKRASCAQACTPGFFCDYSGQCEALGFIGDACEEEDECFSGYCSGGRCVENSQAYLDAKSYQSPPTPNATCTTDLACPSTHYCTNSQCEPKEKPGEACARDGECDTGFCREGRCAEASATPVPSPEEAAFPTPATGVAREKQIALAQGDAWPVLVVLALAGILALLYQERKRELEDTSEAKRRG